MDEYESLSHSQCSVAEIREQSLASFWKIESGVAVQSSRGVRRFPRWTVHRPTIAPAWRAKPARAEGCANQQIRSVPHALLQLTSDRVWDGRSARSCIFRIGS